MPTRVFVHLSCQLWKFIIWMESICFLFECFNGSFDLLFLDWHQLRVEQGQTAMWVVIILCGSGTISFVNWFAPSNSSSFSTGGKLEKSGIGLNIECGSDTRRAYIDLIPPSATLMNIWQKYLWQFVTYANNEEVLRNSYLLLNVLAWKVYKNDEYVTTLLHIGLWKHKASRNLVVSEDVWLCFMTVVLKAGLTTTRKLK